jgi:3-hydroxyisobutyrate dehydrogenase-like beta-hydroxyacid dehydrogenase
VKIGFVGLGVMGYPMAGHLLRAGHDVHVFNRSPEKARRWREEFGGEIASTPADAAQESDMVCLCVGNDDDVRSVTLGSDGVLAALARGALLIDHTTASAELARELHTAAIRVGAGFLDAPVSGGQAGAENGALTIMVGGEPADFDRAQPVLATYARCVQLLGPAGAGQLAKMVNQICIAGIVQGLAEGLAFANAAGLDEAAVIEVISQGAAQSWQMENRYQSMLSSHYEHGFAVDWMRKDLAMVKQHAGGLGLELPITSLVDTFYAQVQAMGGGRWDTSSLYARMQSIMAQPQPVADDNDMEKP